MKRTQVRTSVNRCTVFAALLAVVIASAGVGFAQASEGWAIDQVQRVVRERIASQQSERDLAVRFGGDALTESRSNTNLWVRGTGRVVRGGDGKSRAFSYEASIDTRNNHVSALHYGWRGTWHEADADRLTGTYRLDGPRSDDAGPAADRATLDEPGEQQQRLRAAIGRQVEAPQSLEIERNGRTITIASSQARQVTFEADGREQIEQWPDGQQTRTTATLAGDRLIITRKGDRSVDYHVTFESIDNGRGLRLTRRITYEDLLQPIVARSVYDKTAAAPQFDVSRTRDNRGAAERSSSRSVVPDGTALVAVLNDQVSAKQARDGDPFTLSVRSPSAFAGATMEGHVVQAEHTGQVPRHADLSFEFDTIRMRDGRRYEFAGSIESVRTSNHDVVRLDHEGRVQDEGSRAERTVEHPGKADAIGAVIGAVAGGGSFLVQGRTDLELSAGTEFRIRAGSRR